MLTHDAQRTTHDDGRQPIAIGHLSDSGDLKTQTVDYILMSSVFCQHIVPDLVSLIFKILQKVLIFGIYISDHEHQLPLSPLQKKILYLLMKLYIPLSKYLEKKNL